ncbi:MAG: Rrf2 family transcriptional regulator [Acidobacteria bacterium]|nr:Rrf2 family transcriptional regulator [Acidobacteriota bacterium]
MKFSSQEEYGLRCLLRIAREGGAAGLTIPEISEAEGISGFYVAKLMRVLRRGGLVKSARGKIGGYTLSRPPSEIVVGEALALLGGRLFESDFCTDHAGAENICTSSVDCSIRSLWKAVQHMVDRVLSKTTLADLLGTERELATHVTPLVQLPDASQTRQLNGSGPSKNH